MLSDRPEIGRQTRVVVEPISIGAKLSRRTWRSLLLRWVPYVARLREALERQAPHDVLLVHYKKEQLMAPFLPARLRPTLVWAEWGPVPFELRRGLPRLLYLFAARRAKLIMAVSQSTKTSVQDVGIPGDKIVVVPNVVDVDAIRYSDAGQASRPRAARHPTGRVRGRLHLTFSPQEAKRRRRRRCQAARRSARPSDPRRSRRNRGGAASAVRIDRRPRPFPSDADRRRRRCPERI